MVGVRTLKKELEAVAVNECKEVKENIPNVIKEFQKWIKEHPHLKARTNEQFLIAFLRHCHYDLNCAQERFYFYYEYKSTSGLLVNPKIDTKLLEICDSG